MAVVGSTRIGRYACLSTEVTANLHYTETARGLSVYVIKMAELGISDRLEFESKAVSDCLKAMESFGIVQVK